MFIKIGGLILVVAIITSQTQTVKEPNPTTIRTPDGASTVPMNRRQESNNSSKSTKKKWKFEDYLKKFEPAIIWEQIDKQKKYNGLILSDKEQSEMMIRAIDPTDELMALKVENGDPKLVLDQNGRRKYNAVWRPSKSQLGYSFDRFNIRPRLHELMKQAIFTTRNKMVVMQTYREKYRNSSIYKMGFLFNKADNAAKTFGKFSFKAYRNCILAREKVVIRMFIYEYMAANERQLHLWFNVELLADLIIENDMIAKEIIKRSYDNRMALLDKHFKE